MKKLEKVLSILLAALSVLFLLALIATAVLSEMYPGLAALTVNGFIGITAIVTFILLTTVAVALITMRTIAWTKTKATQRRIRRSSILPHRSSTARLLGSLWSLFKLIPVLIFKICTWLFTFKDDGLFRVDVPLKLGVDVVLISGFLLFTLTASGIIPLIWAIISSLVVLAGTNIGIRTIYENGYLNLPAKPYKFALKILGEYYREGTTVWCYVFKSLQKKSYKVTGPDGKEKNVPFDKLPIPLFSGGNTFFLFYPWFQSFVLVDVSSQNYDENISEVRTNEDQVDSDLNIELSFFISDFRKFLEFAGEIKEKTEAKHFLNVKKVFMGMMAEPVREHAENPNHGPNKWELLAAAGKEFIELILTQVSESTDAKMDVEKLGKGNGNVVIKGLGITVSKLNITKVKPDEKVEKAKEDVNIYQRRQEKEEIKRKIQKIVQESTAEGVKFYKDLGVDPKTSINVVQSQRGEATRIIYDFEGGGQSPFLILNPPQAAVAEPKKKKGGDE